MYKLISYSAVVMACLLACNDQATATQPLPPNVEMVAHTKIAGLETTVASVRDNKRGVTCYISVVDISGVSTGTDMSCIPDAISGKTPEPVTTAPPQK